MIKTIVILLSLCWGFECRAQTDSVAATNPEFPGGWSAMRALMNEQMHYPQEAQDKGFQGKCYLQFVVEADGTITNVRVTRGVPDCHECDKEAVRFMKNMPAWIPATENGEPVRSNMQLSFSFRVH